MDGTAKQHMRSILPVLLLLLSPLPIRAQIITTVDALSNVPLASVVFFNEDSTIVLSSDTLGQVSIAPFRESAFIEVQMLGYATQRLTYDSLVTDALLLLTPIQLALDGIVVAANRWGQARREVPARVSILDKREIALQQPQTAADLLGTTGEIFIQKSQLGGGSPMIRGFSTNRLLYTIDGIRMNSAIFRSGNLHNVISLDPFAIDRTEVIFGPGSVLYGSDAIGGVMAFQTLRPNYSASTQSQFGIAATFRHATANREQTGHVHASVGWQKWALLSSITATQFGDLRMGSNGPDDYLRTFYTERINGEDRMLTNPDPRVQRPTGYGQINLMQKIQFRPSADWEFRYGFHYSSTTDFPRYDRLIRMRNGQARSAEWEYSPQTWQLQLLEAIHTARSPWFDQLHFRAAYQQFGEGRIDRDFNDPWRTIRNERVNAWSINLDAQKQFDERHQLTYGLEWVQNEVQSEGQQLQIERGAERAASARYPLANWSSYAAYLNYQYRLRTNWLVQFGTRYNGFSLAADFSNNLLFFPFPQATADLRRAALTTSLGTVWQPGKRWTLSVKLATGFRAPNVDDIGKVFDSEPGSVVIPNPNLQPEYAYNAEIGGSHRLGDRLKMDLSVYFTCLDQALVRRNFQLNGQDSIFYDGALSQVQALQNAAQAQVYGLQTGLEWQFAKVWGWRNQFNLQYGEEELDDGSTSPSRHAAPAFGQSTLYYRTERLQLQLRSVFQLERPFASMALEEQGKPFLYAADPNGNPFSPAWYTLDFRGRYQFGSALQLTVALENLTDRRYRPYSSGIAGAGRQLRFSLSAQL